MAEPYRKKLIEVALPLEAINRESAREKSIRHGHPSTLHRWWSRKPLAVCRAVIFASLVDDPASRPGEFPTEADQERERQRLFRIIEELVKWENSNNETVLQAARAEIMKATDNNPPPVADPFCGGGSIPLEAQRLALVAHASDLNPVAVLITKALIEIPPKFAGKAPVNPEAREKLAHGANWERAQGLAEDVRYYGKWMREEALGCIGHLYPKAQLPDGEATVIAWIWARTILCPNPACGRRMPLAAKFTLATKPQRSFYVDPIPTQGSDDVTFAVKAGLGAPAPTKYDGGARCLFCGTDMPDARVREQATQHGLGRTLMAAVLQGKRQRDYITSPHETVIAPEVGEMPWLDAALPSNPRWFSPPGYGLTTYRDLFTDRQLVCLETFSKLLVESRDRIVNDGGTTEYADAVMTYLALAIDRLADRGSTICVWDSSPKMEAIRNTFALQAIPMSWDFVEGNPFSEASGNWMNHIEWISKVIERLEPVAHARVHQLDAKASIASEGHCVISTDPPYYDNIGFSELTDFFYVWLRHNLGGVYTNLFSTLLAPRKDELTASPYRFNGDKDEAKRAFERTLRDAFERARESQHGDYPLTVYYAFKETESLDGGGSVSTGWDKLLTALISSKFLITGTWPVRSEMSNRTVARGTNALASSIVLACRPRPSDAPLTTRRDFISDLKSELPLSLRMLQHGNIAPVDLAQAAIGPGMAIFSRYARVVEADGSEMTVRAALGLINQALDEILAEQEGDFDADTRFAVTWFEQRGMAEGPYGEADVLARAKDTSVGGMEEAGILISHAGKVRLKARGELDGGWDPATDRRLTVWEVAQHLIRRLEEGGEDEAAELLRRVGGLGEAARELAYRLYQISERKAWAQEALGYNAIVVSWPEIQRLAAGQSASSAQQTLGV
jgi:putative DNA methylase